MPGFETAKPIGTALNDWGKKDAERLAFEDADVFVRDDHNIVKVRNNPEDKSKPAADWHAKDGKPPYEQVYFEALKHHRREGFLHQKLHGAAQLRLPPPPHLGRPPAHAAVPLRPRQAARRRER